MIEKLAWTREAWADYLYWQNQDRKTLRRINQLIRSSLREPHDGPGKPEKLKGDLSGLWSRRIDHVIRLVYVVNGTTLVIISCRYHY